MINRNLNLLSRLGLFALALVNLSIAGSMTPELRARAMQVLVDGIDAEEFWPAMHAAEGLTIAGEGDLVRQKLSARLPIETDDQRRCGLAREMVRAGDGPKSAVMIAILADPTSNGRVHAAESLYKVGWQGDADSYLRAVWHPESDFVLQLVAVAALAKHGSAADQADSLAFLREALDQVSDQNHLRLVAWVLARVGDASDIERIRPKLKLDLDERPRVFLEHALALLGDEAGRKALTRNLESDDASTRTYAAVFAGEAGMTEVMPQLARQLEDPDLDARIRAAQALFALEK